MSQSVRPDLYAIGTHSPQLLAGQHLHLGKMRKQWLQETVPMFRPQAGQTVEQDPHSACIPGAWRYVRSTGSPEMLTLVFAQVAVVPCIQQRLTPKPPCADSLSYHKQHG